SAGGEVRLHEWPSGKRLRGLGHGAHALAFSPDGKRLAASWHSVVRVYDGEGERKLASLSGHENHVVGLAFSPDSQQLATAGVDTTVRLWDVERAEQVSIWRGHRGRANRVAFHPDGWMLASSSSQPGEVRLWDLTRQQEAMRINDTFGTAWVEAIALDRAGGVVSVGRPGGRVIPTLHAVTP